MSVLLFLFGFLVAGITGAKMLASLEPVPSEQIGAQAFLFLLCVIVSPIAFLFYLFGAHRFRRTPNGVASLIGGLVAVGALFAATRSNYYFGVPFELSLPLALVLASLVAFIWPLLTARTRSA